MPQRTGRFSRAKVSQKWRFSGPGAKPRVTGNQRGSGLIPGGRVVDKPDHPELGALPTS